MAANILVVEDQRSIAGAMRMRLRGLGYGVLDIARTGDEAVAMATRLRPDLILMDVRLGEGIDGIEAARRIRAEIDIPVIYVTAYADRELLERALDTHPAGFINKPYTTKDLLTTINLALARDNVAPRPLVLLREAVITASRDGRVEFINGAAERITGWTHRQLRGRRLAEVLALLHGLAPAQADAVIAEVLASGGQHALGPGPDSDLLTATQDIEGQCDGLALHIGSAGAQAGQEAMRRTQRVLHHLLDLLAVGILVVDRELRVVYHNRVAQRLLQRRHPLGLDEGFLHASAATDHETLTALVHGVTQREAPVDPDAADLLMLGDEKTQQLAVIVTRGVPRDALADDVPAMVLVFDLTAQPQLSASALRELYGLTRSETALVQALAGGASLEDGAGRLGIAVNTARTHLKHIFHKTDSKRQSELIHKVELGPAQLPLRVRRRH